MSEHPKGIVVCFIDDNGNVVASVSDFSTDGYGGFGLQEAQEIRAKRLLKWEVANAYCSKHFVRAMETFHAEATVDALIRKHGCKIHVTYIGWGGDQ